MSRQRLAVIVNPHGGRKRGLKVLNQVKPVLSANGTVLDINITQHAGHAGEMAKYLELDRYDGICVIGGDGTIHEVADGLMQRGEPVSVPLGIIPAGSGNTMHQHLQCDNPLEAARRIAAGETLPLDVVRVNMENHVVYCVDLIGWGAVADINCTSEKWRVLGLSRYTLSSLWHILWCKPRPARLMLNDQVIDDEFLFIVACNSKYAGRGLQLAPHAEMDDGKIDIVYLRRASRLQMLTVFRRIYDGSHLSLRYLEYHQVRSFAIESLKNEPLDLDGEIKGYSPFSAEVMPGALRLFG